MAVSPLEDRYKTEMNSIFSEESKLRSWIRVEIALAHANEKLGIAPKGSAAEIEAAGKKVQLSRVLQIESEIHHDLMAMVKALSEQCKTYGGYVHLGSTSYDIEDTATALIFLDAISVIEKHLLETKQILRSLALSKKSLVCMGRTHGQHAVPTTYGLKFAIYYCEVKRHLQRLQEARSQIAFGKMSGATGTMATFRGKGFAVQELVMKELSLHPSPASNQVIQRDRHAQSLFALALISATLEKIAKEIRNLQRSELMEISEPFGAKQVGSSTMPQKRNPHKSERICSLARLVRSNVQTALENIPLEHERDLTNSANERFIFPESFIVTDYMLLQMNSILSGLVFYPKNIERNLQLTGGLIMSERIMIELTHAGMGRQDAHELVRTAAQESFTKQIPFSDVLSKNAHVKKLLGKKLPELLNPKTYVGEAEKIVENALKE
ncbi:Argininosuccinate lyase [Candidatus Anstonella stagnisolia]|nr:Argininosuccinate lyase [Candidatus Anstonella stagnisolia]